MKQHERWHSHVTAPISLCVYAWGLVDPCCVLGQQHALWGSADRECQAVGARGRCAFSYQELQASLQSSGEGTTSAMRMHPSP